MRCSNQPQWLLAAGRAEQPFAGAEDHREDHRPQLIDQVAVEQGLRELGAPVDDDPTVDLALQPLDLVGDGG